MATGDISVIEYQMEYPTLNLKHKQDNPMMFDYGMLYCYTKECERGFKVKRINKTTGKGTKFTYIAIKDDEDFEAYKTFVDKMIDEFNSKYGDAAKVKQVSKDLT